MDTLKNKLRINDAANYLGVSSKTLRRWGKSGKLVSKRSEGGHRYYTREQLDNFRFADKTETAVFPNPLKNKDHTIALSFTVIMLSLGLGLNNSSPLHTTYHIPYTAESSKPAVLAASDEGITPSVAGFTFAVNVPSKFSDTVTFLKDIVAPNVVYSVNNETGSITIDNSLTAGSGISITDRTITNNGIVTLSAGTGIEVDGNKITNTYSFTPDYTLGGWTRTGTTVGLTTLTDSVTVGALTAGAVTVDSLTTGGLSLTSDLTVSSGHSLLPSVDLGSDIGSSSYRFNNLWVANINSNSSQAFSGQTTFSYPPTNTTIDQASVLINPTTSIANGQLLGLAVGGYQKALIDEDGDMILGYNSLTSAPATDYPLNIYGHNGTRVSFVDTSGNGYFAGNVGIGTSASSNLLDVTDGTGSIFSVTRSGSVELVKIGALRLQEDNNNGYVGNYTASTQTLYLQNWGSGKLNLDLNESSMYIVGSSGNVGIGTTAPGEKLEVNGNVKFSVDSVVKFPTSATGLSFKNGSNTSILTLDGYGSVIVYPGSETRAGVGFNSTNGMSQITANTLSFLTNGTEKIRINSSGNVGIGTTSPNEKLEVGGDIRVWNTGSQGQIDFSQNNNYVGIRGVYQTGLFFKTGGSDRVNITETGNVGIGTTSPIARLQIDSTSEDILLARLNASYDTKLQANGTYGVRFGTAGATNFNLMSNNTVGLTLSSTGNVGIGTTSPSSKLDITTNSLNATQTTSSGLALVNTTAATSGSQQISPAIRWSGQGWKTDAIATSQAVEFIADVLPIQGTSSPTGLWKLKASINGASYTDKFVINTNGQIVPSSTAGLADTSTGIWKADQLLTSNNNITLNLLGARTYTTNDSAIDINPTFAPTSGSTAWRSINLKPTINQTGGANGSTRALYINPTLTSVADFRAIEIANNSGYGLYQSGSNTINYFSGNVGIGTTSPGYKLDVTGDIRSSANIWSGAVASGEYYGSGGTTRPRFFGVGGNATSGEGMQFLTTYTNTSGSRSFMLVSPTYNQTSGTAANTDLLINRTETAVGSGSQLLIDTQVGGVSKFSISNTGSVTTSSLTTGTVYSNNGVLTNTDPSDINLKTNVLSLPDGTLDKVLGLRTVSYNWKSTGDGALGFIAQEVQQVFPELVGTNNDGSLGLYTTQFIPLLTKALQEQQVEVDTQKTKLDEFTAFVKNVFTEFKNKFRTKELCIGEDGSETCVTKEQLDELIKLLPSPTPTAVTSPSVSPESSSEVTTTPTVSPTPIPTVEPSPTSSPISE